MSPPHPFWDTNKSLCSFPSLPLYLTHALLTGQCPSVSLSLCQQGVLTQAGGMVPTPCPWRKVTAWQQGGLCVGGSLLTKSWDRGPLLCLCPSASVFQNMDLSNKQHEACCRNGLYGYQTLLSIHGNIFCDANGPLKYNEYVFCAMTSTNIVCDLMIQRVVQSMSRG